MDSEAKRVLLVEDDRVLRRVGEVTLTKAGFVVLTAVDGEEAVRVARAELPDLILLDLIMPKMDGFEVLRTLKADQATRAIPVIVLSNLGQDKDVAEAMAGGAAAFIMKASLPLNEYVGRITEVLGRT